MLTTAKLMKSLGLFVSLHLLQYEIREIEESLL
jgi:hypothetical protein